MMRKMVSPLIHLGMKSRVLGDISEGGRSPIIEHHQADHRMTPNQTMMTQMTGTEGHMDTGDRGDVQDTPIP